MYDIIVSQQIFNHALMDYLDLLVYSCILKISTYYSFFFTTYYSNYSEQNNNAFGHAMVSSLQVHTP